MKLDQKPRWVLPATSLMYVALTPYSPPSANPCTMRAVTSKMGAAIPMLAAPGVSAMASEPRLISATDATIAFLRPKRSE